MTQWEPASGHPKGWRVIRYKGKEGFLQQQLTRKTGGPVLFKSYEAARKRADKMNNSA